MSIAFLIAVTLAFSAPSFDIKLSDEAVKTVNQAVLLLNSKLGDKELEYLESLSQSDNLTARSIAIVALYKQNPVKYESRVFENFSVHDYVDRSKGKYNYVGEEEMISIVKEVREQNPKLEDQRVYLLILFLHYRDQNKWIYSKRLEQKLSVARFFRSAFLASTFEGTNLDALDLTNRIDIETQKKDLNKPPNGEGSKEIGKNDESKKWENYVTGGFAMIIPKGWRHSPIPAAGTPLFLSGDGIAAPVVDDTEEPLQIGLYVNSMMHRRENLDETMSRLISDLKGDLRLAPFNKERVEKVTLLDGTPALFLTADLIKEEDRRSVQMKLVTKSKESTVWIVSAFIVGGKAGKYSDPDSDLGKRLRTHMLTFCFDESKLDDSSLRKVYAIPSK